jgi:hypothetical protein
MSDLTPDEPRCDRNCPLCFPPGWQNDEPPEDEEWLALWPDEEPTNLNPV